MILESDIGAREKKHLWDIQVLRWRLTRLEEEHGKLMAERSDRISELTDKCNALKMELVMSSPFRTLTMEDISCPEPWSCCREKEALKQRNQDLQREVARLQAQAGQLLQDKAKLQGALNRCGGSPPVGLPATVESTSSVQHHTQCKCSQAIKRCHRRATALGSRSDGDSSGSDICADAEHSSPSAASHPTQQTSTGPPWEDPGGPPCNGGCSRKRMSVTSDAERTLSAAEAKPACGGHHGRTKSAQADGPVGPGGSTADFEAEENCGPAHGEDAPSTMAPKRLHTTMAKLLEAEVARLEYPLKKLKLT